MFVLSGILAAALAAAHALAAYLRFIHLTPRSRWLSFASGVSVAFVFLQLLPELHAAHIVLRGGEDAAEQGGNQFYPAYTLALIGLVLFYGLEVAVRLSRRRFGKPEAQSPTGMFILHVGAFAIYNALIGAILVNQSETDVARQVVFFLGLALHLVINDFALREHHQREYHRYGRWVLAGAVLSGWLTATLVDIPDDLFSAMIALVAGAIILNVLKEELPAERESRFGAFSLGCVIFAAIWLVSGLM